MNILFLILIILASVLLALIVLVQNPKGGGLSGNIAGFSNQFMGVKQTTDVLEKGTWILAAVVVVLCLFSSLLIRDGGKTENDLIKGINPNAAGTAPAQQVPAGPAPVPVQPAPGK
jgi:preprotein translocase subunit SecG